MKIKGTVNNVEKVANRFKLTRRDFIYISVMLVMILGVVGWGFLKEEYKGKVTSTKIIHTNTKQITTLSSKIDANHDDLKDFVKIGIDKSRNETKQEIRDSEKRSHKERCKSEKRINENTSSKINIVVKLIPSITEKDAEIIKEINKLKDKDGSMIYENNIEKNISFGHIPLDISLNNSPLDYTPEILRHEAVEKPLKKEKRGWIKRIFKKKKFF